MVGEMVFIHLFLSMMSALIKGINWYWNKSMTKGLECLTLIKYTKTMPMVNPTIRGGLLKPPLNKNHVFGTFLWSKWPEKIWLFPNIYDNASHTLSGSQKALKTGFYSIFVVGGPKIRIRKCGFLAFLGLKWTKLVSKTQN